MRAHRAEQRRSKGPSVRVGHEVLPGLADWPSPSAIEGGAVRLLDHLGGGSARVGSERGRLLSSLCLLRAVRNLANLLPGYTRRKGVHIYSSSTTIRVVGAFARMLLRRDLLPSIRACGGQIGVPDKEDCTAESRNYQSQECRRSGCSSTPRPDLH